MIATCRPRRCTQWIATRPARPRCYRSADVRKASHDHGDLAGGGADERGHAGVLARIVAGRRRGGGALAVFATQWPGIGGFAAALGWLVAVVLLLLAVAPLRRAVISDRVLPLLRRALPAMSQTERDALEAGTVWWDAELFSGRPDRNKLLAIPKPQLSAHEQAYLDGPEA